jgi:hypothetical protein
MDGKLESYDDHKICRILTVNVIVENDHAQNKLLHIESAVTT